MANDLATNSEAVIEDEDLVQALIDQRLLSTDRILIAQRHAAEQKVSLERSLRELHLVLPGDLEKAVSEARAKGKTAESKKIEALKPRPAPGTDSESDAAKAAELEKVGELAERDLRAELRTIAETAVPTDLINEILSRAIIARATDVHIDPRVGHHHIRFRIDSKLHEILDLDSETGQAVVRGLKIASNMNLVEQRHPQDGSLAIRHNGRMQNIRSATLPTTNGEKIVLRILESLDTKFDLGVLGLEPHQAQKLNQFLARPYGAILVGGPVGAGKTTTLYSCLDRVTHPSRNVLTVEDPVEYRFPAVNQVEINTQIGLNFAEGLRAILRQDPDVLMIGEIRDEETAAIGIRAALTGVLVFSTIHASDAAGTIGSLINYKIPGFTLASALQGVVNQRLVRKICSHCRVGYQADETILRALKLDPDEHRALTLYRGEGCSACFHSGYLGRIGIYEIMDISDLVRELILLETTKDVIRQVARDEGMKTLRESAITKVIQGLTTVEELYRVTL